MAGIRPGDVIAGKFRVEEFGELLQSCRSTEETSEVTSLYARRLFPAERGMVSVTNASRNLVESLAWWGAEAPAELTFGPAECWALRRGRPHVLSAKTGGVRCRHVPEGSTASYACIPMMAQGETLGILHVMAAGSEELSKAQLQLAVVTSERVGLALANTRLREQLRSQSIRDPLTGLYNRRYLEESLDRDACVAFVVAGPVPTGVSGCHVPFANRIVWKGVPGPRSRATPVR